MLGFGPWEASPATPLLHAPSREELHLWTIPPAKFHHQLPSDAPGSGRRTRLRPLRWVTGFLHFSGHFRPIHTSLPPFLDPLNSFPWSFSSDSSPFERYDENKVSRLLDRVFRPPQKPLGQGKSTDVFLVSWAFH